MRDMVLLFLKRTPLVKFMMPFLLGIIAGYEWSIPARVVLVSFLLSVFVYFLIIRISSKYHLYHIRFVPGVCLIIAALSWGIFYMNARLPNYVNADSEVKVVVRFLSNTGESAQSFKYEGQLMMSEDSIMRPVMHSTGKIYLKKGSWERYPKPGEVWLLKGRLMPFVSPALPYMFNYSEYLIKNRIAFQLYCSDQACLLSLQDHVFNLEVFFAKIKEQLLSQFRNHGMGEQELAVLNALFLGDKTDLSAAQKESYSSAGAMHLLAVSGLHVGIIYLLALFLLKSVGISRNSLLMALSILLLLWLYAILTGLSPSVMRATIMFSMLEVGRWSKRRLYIFNVIAASMLIILLIDPLAVFSIGFWLSHVAVMSIVLFYPLINRWFTFNFCLFKWLWSLIAVSLAAQVGTIPICIAFFHDFPVYFLITNLMLLPLVAPILLLAIVSLLFQFSSFVSEMLIGCLTDLIRFLNNAVTWIEGLPYAVWTHLDLNWLQGMLYYGFVLSILFYVEKKHLPYLRRAILVGLVFVFSLTFYPFFIPAKVLIIATIRGELVVNYFDHRTNEVYIQSEKLLSHLPYYFKGVWAHYHASACIGVKSKKDLIYGSFDVKQVGDKVIVIVRDGKSFSAAESLYVVDWIVCNDVSYQDITSIESMFSFKKIVIPQCSGCYAERKWLSKKRKNVERIYVLDENKTLVVEESPPWRKLYQIIFGNMVTLSLNLR